MTIIECIEKTLFSLYLRTTGKSRDSYPVASHRHVSLANIATAFLSERKTSSRRQNSVRRKKRLTIKDKRTSNTRIQSNVTNNILEQRLSGHNMDNGIVTIFMTTANAASNNKHRANLVRKSY